MKPLTVSGPRYSTEGRLKSYSPRGRQDLLTLPISFFAMKLSPIVFASAGLIIGVGQAGAGPKQNSIVATSITELLDATGRRISPQVLRRTCHDCSRTHGHRFFPSGNGLWTGPGREAPQYLVDYMRRHRAAPWLLR